MGVADNRSYKDEYLFNEKHNGVFRNPNGTAEDNPSINVDPKVHATIKENPYRSNVEIEGREVVLQPDLSALFNAVGKRHSRGGMDVLLKPDSFIFSDFEDLALSKKDHELFELKEGGKKSTDTPADVLKRNVNLKHYNSLITILGDPNKDDLAKTSATRMLDKYIKTLGNIAYIQEEKKQFPQGIPDFAMDTAPVYNTELKDQLMENKQYAKAGGRVDNPYLPKAQRGRIVSDPVYKSTIWDDVIMPQSRITPIYEPSTRTGHPNSTVGITPNQSANQIANQSVSLYDAPTGTEIDPMIKPFYDTAVADARKGLKRSDSYKNLQAKFHELYPNEAKNILSQFNVTNYGKANNISKDKLESNLDSLWGPRTKQYLAYISKKPTDVNPPWQPGLTSTYKGGLDLSSELPKPELTKLNPEEVKGDPQGVKTANWKFTPWQRLSHTYDWMNALNVNKYNPDRAHYNTTYTNPALVNPEQAVGDAKGVFNQSMNAISSLSPILRNAQGAQSYGQALNTIPGIRSQYDNQNVGIVNQFRQYNNQIKNNESLLNMQNDKDYSKDSITAEVNYDNMKTYLRNIAMGNTMKDVATNQKLAYSLLQQNNPAWSFDWDNGYFNRTNKSIMDVSVGDAKSDMYTELAQTIMAKIRSGKNPTPEEVNFMKSLAVGKLNFSQGSGDIPFKKGGRMRVNPYK